MAMDVLGAVVTTVEGTTLPEAVKLRVTEPLGMTDTGFHVADRHRLVTHYGDGEPEPVRMADDQIVFVYGSPVSFAPGRLFDADAYPSAGAGMAGTAIDFLTFLETIRTRGGSILKPERSEEHTSELQSLMRISYAVFCLKNKIDQLSRTTMLAPDNNTQV